MSRPNEGVKERSCITALFSKTAKVAVFAMLAASAAQAQTVPQSREQVQMSFSPVVKQVAPAVVNIYTRKVVHAVASPFMNDPFFRQFFGGRMGIPQDRVQRSLGSGVLVKADGTVVTNFHVVRDSDEITVVLPDRREFEAKVLGTDERTDLAVLKIDAGGQPLPVLTIGDSDAVEVGDLVLALGNPFGVGQTVTMGIVSALARTTVGISNYQSFIQTDAAINPGNSGGALVDLHGNLVGINSSIISSGEGGGSVGIGFAIPAAMVKAVLASITNGGKVQRPWLGGDGQPVTSEMFRELKLARPTGVLINSVHPGGPAAQAGLKVGDVVTAVNGREVEDPEALRFRIATLPVGGSAQLTVMRSGDQKTLSVKLAPPPDSPARDTSELAGRTPFTGATVANMNPALAEELGLESADPGITVVKVRPGTIAARLQFQPGDMILRINNKPLANVAELKSILVDPMIKGWAITLRRGGETLTVTIGG
jgi:serine protease Do